MKFKFNKKIYIVLTILSLTFLCSLIIGKIHSQNLENQIKEKLISEAQILSQIINPSLAKKIHYDRNAYQFMLNQINTFKKDFSPIEEIYTVIVTKEGFKFGPSTYKKEGSVSLKVAQVLEKRQIIFDKNSNSISLYIPVFDIYSPKILMFLVFEIDIKKWESIINKNFLNYFIFTVALICLLIGVILLLTKFFGTIKDSLSFKISLKNFVPLIIGIFLGITLWGFYNYWYEIQRLKLHTAIYKKNILFQWNENIREQIYIFNKETEKILKNKELIDAFLNRNREVLSHKIQPVFMELKNKYYTTHFIFLEPDLKVFFRAHLPKEYGDRRITPVITEAVNTGKDSWGIEAGTKGGFLLSYAKTIKKGEKIAGYIVLGIQLFEFSKNFFREHDSEIFTVAYKNFMDKEIFEIGKKNYGYTGTWDDYPQIVILNQTMKSVSYEIQKMFRENSFHEMESYYFKKNSTVYGYDIIPLVSKSGQRVGYILVMKDFGFLWSVVSKRNFLNLIFVFTLCFGNLFLLRILTDNANKRLDETFNMLQQKERDLEEEAVRSKELAIQAKTSDFAKTQFLLSMSHEIRTPLNTIVGITHLLSKTPLNFQQMDYLKRINNASEALIELINNILDLSKIEAGKLELDKKEFKLDDLIDKVISIFVPRCNEKDIKFSLFISSDVPNRLIGDLLRLKQVLMNLLWNALKFTESGMIQLSIKVEEWIKDSQVKILFSVKDTGIGISEEKNKEIFEPFTQLTYKEKGTGLGLALCKRLVELMGGQIWVESELGKGSDFKFTAIFDFVPAETHTLSMLEGKTALCVDDNPELLKRLQENLESIGISVICESSGKEALKIIQKKFVDFLIVDLTTDDLSGRELIENIEKNVDIKAKPCMIMLVPYKDVSIIDKIHLRQRAKILIKPFVCSILQNALLECLGYLKKKKKKNCPKLFYLKKAKFWL